MCTHYYYYFVSLIEARRDDCADSVENEVNRILPSIEYDERNVIPSLSEKDQFLESYHHRRAKQ